MVSERKEPTLSSSNLDAEERAQIQKKLNPQAAGKSTTEKQPAPPRKVAPAAAARSPLLPLALILALTALGLAGFVYWQFLQAQQILIAAEQRIVELEQRLNLSSDESSESLTVLQANLKEANSEIAKLWDTRNVNRKGIADNERAVNAVEKSVKELTTNLASAKQTATAQDGTLKSLSAKVEQAVAASETSKKELAALDKSLKALAKQLDQASAGIKQVGDLGIRVQTNEEAIEAIDAYRYQINRQIIDIQKRLGN